MSKILILSTNSEITDDLINLFGGIGYDAISVATEQEAVTYSNEFAPDIAIIDTSIENLNISSVCRSLKLQNETNDTQLILLTSEESSSREVLVGADGYITKPFNENILIATVNAHLRIKKLLDILYSNNSELAKSLYQLNVLYSISSQLAGTLDKTKLVTIMNFGLDKGLNFSLCHALIMNHTEDATLIITSKRPVSDTLETALKLRAMLSYKSLFEENDLPFELSMNNITVEKHVKDEDDGEEGILDLNVLVRDRMFLPISTSDRFFGTVEVIRQNEFSGEDSTCFQTIVKQVALPLESALLYEEIQKTNIKLEKLEKLKSEFISIVSHELRTPLTSIKNSLEMMITGRTGEISEVQGKFLNIAKRNVDRLAGIINDLLDLSKIEAGKMEYRFEPLNILEPVKFVISSFESLADKKNIQLSFNSTNDELKIYGDAGKIEQVLNNIISNAIKFTPNNGKISVNIEEIDSDFVDAELSSDSESYIKITVEDSGIGIKNEDLPKVFDKFRQIESSLSRESGGTGLGLPIAKQLIEAHRGQIRIESEFNKGSKFCIIIPLLKQNNIFLFELDNFLQKAKYNHSAFTLVLLEETDSGTEIILNKIKDSVNGDSGKIFSENNKIQIILPEYNKERIREFAKNIKTFASEKDLTIKTGFSIYPDDGITSEELLDFAKKSCDSVEEIDLNACSVKNKS